MRINFHRRDGSGHWEGEWPCVPNVGHYIEPPHVDYGPDEEPARKRLAGGAVTRVTWETDGVTVWADIVLGAE